MTPKGLNTARAHAQPDSVVVEVIRFITTEGRRTPAQFT